MPLLQLPEGRVQHPFTDWRNQAAVLGNRNEVQRADKTHGGMFPSQQGLDTDNHVSADIDFWLIEYFQLVAVNGISQTGFHVQLFAGASIHFGGVINRLVAAEFLGPVHTDVSMFYQCLCVCAIVGIDADADAGGDMQFMTITGYRVFQARSDFPGNTSRIGGTTDAWQQYHELITAEACDGVFLAHTIVQSTRDDTQQLISDGMTQ